MPISPNQNYQDFDIQGALKQINTPRTGYEWAGQGENATYQPITEPNYRYGNYGLLPIYGNQTIVGQGQDAERVYGSPTQYYVSPFLDYKQSGGRNIFGGGGSGKYENTPFDIYDASGNFQGSSKFQNMGSDSFTDMMATLTALGGGAVAGGAVLGSMAAGAGAGSTAGAMGPLTAAETAAANTALEASLAPYAAGGAASGAGAGVFNAAVDSQAANAALGADALSGYTTAGIPSVTISNLPSSLLGGGITPGNLLSLGQSMSKGSSGGGGGTQTVQKADPWSGIQPALLALYAGALNNYNTQTPQFFPGSTVAPRSPYSTMAQDAIAQRAGAPSSVDQAAQNQLSSTLAGQYLGQNNPYTQGLQYTAGRDVNTYAGGIGLQNMGFNPTNIKGQSTLENIGSGSMLNANPYVDDMFNRASEAVGRQFKNNVMPGVASMFAGAGRFGSNQMREGVDQATSTYGNTLNNLATDIYGGNYARERGMQQDALNMLGQQSLSSRGLQQQALGQAGSLDVAATGNQLNAYGQMQDAFGRERAMQLSMAGMSPQIANQDFTRLSMLQGLGQQDEAYRQQQLNSEIERFNFGQNAPQMKLQQLSALLNGGLGPLSGSTTSQTGGGSPLMGALGGAMMGGQFGNMLPGLINPIIPGGMGAGASSMFGPLGTLGGAILGGLFS